MLQRLTIAIVTLLATAAFSVAAPKQKTGVLNDQAAEKLPSWQVVFDSKPLFTIRESVFSYTPKDRATMISQKLAQLADNSQFQPDTIAPVEGERVTEIMAGETVIMVVTDRDAAADKKTRTQLAAERAGIMRAALNTYRAEYSTHSIMLGILYTLLSTVVLSILLATIFRLFPKLIIKIESLKGGLIRTIRLQSVEIINDDRIISLLIATAKIMRLLIILGLFDIYVPLVFSFFPWTRGIASKLFDYLLLPMEKIGGAFLSYVPNIFFIAVIIVVTNFANKICRFFFVQIERKTITLPGFYPEWADASFKIVRFLILAFAAIMVFPYLPGSESAAFKGISVFLGILLSLGSSSAVANVVAGAILTYMRAFKIGDRVQIADTIGDVVEKTLLVTRVRTIKNVDITVPNSMVLGSHIVNYSSSAKEYGLILHTSVTIGYDAPWRKVHELLIEAAKNTENILKLPEPFVFQKSLDDFYVNYEINVYTEKPSIMAKIYSDLHMNIQDKFNEAGVEIMSPHYAQLRDGNITAIPAEYLEADYEPGGIRLSRTAKRRTNNQP